MKKTKSTLAPKLQVSIRPRPHLWICAFKTAETLGPELQVSMVPRPYLWFCVYKTACLASRFASLYGSQPSSVVLCMQNSEFSNQKFNSLWVPALICSFVHSKPRI